MWGAWTWPESADGADAVKEREGVAVCSTIRKTETDVSTTGCFSQHFEHTCSLSPTVTEKGEGGLGRGGLTCSYIQRMEEK